MPDVEGQHHVRNWTADREKAGGHVGTKPVRSQEFRAPSHPNSRTEKNCPKLPTVWIMPCCWLVILLRGGINFFLNEVVMKIIITLTRTWLGDPGSGLTLHSRHFTVLLGASWAFTHLCSTPAPPERNTHPFVSVTLLVVLWQKHKRRWPNLPCCNAVQPRVLGAPAGPPQRAPRPPVGRGVPRALGSCGLEPVQYGRCRQPHF